MFTYYLKTPWEGKECGLYETEDEAIKAAVDAGFADFHICPVVFGDPKHYEMRPVQIIPN